MEQQNNNKPTNQAETALQLSKPKELATLLIQGITGEGGMKPREVAKRFETVSGEVDFLAIPNKGTQLSVLSRTIGTTALSTNIAFLITDFANSYNVFTPMTDEQIVDLAEEFAVDWWFYTLEDFVCFFQAAKKHKYGVITNRVDRGIILEMLFKYDRARVDAFVENEQIGHQRSSKPLPEQFQEGPYSFADVIRCLKEGITPEDIIREKNNPAAAPPAEGKSTEDLHREAQVNDLRIRAFVAEVLTWEDPRHRYMNPFYKANSEAVEAALKIERKNRRHEGK